MPVSCATGGAFVFAKIAGGEARDADASIAELVQNLR
jgi:hypothetical protein